MFPGSNISSRSRKASLNTTLTNRKASVEIPPLQHARLSSRRATFAAESLSMLQRPRRSIAPQEFIKGRRISSFSHEAIQHLVRRRRSGQRRGTILHAYRYRGTTNSDLPDNADSERLRQLFIRVAKLIIVARRWHTPHLLVKQPELVRLFHRQLGTASQGTAGAAGEAAVRLGLHVETITQHNDMFDPAEYKANKMMRVSTRAKQILQKRPELRTDQEVYYAMLALRQVPQIEDYPVRMQREIARHGVFQAFPSKRLIVRQWRPPNAFYFILYGKVSVAVQSHPNDTPKTACYLSRGDSFGELSIIENSDRQSSVLSHGYTELLSIDDETYRKLFMVGGVRNLNDPDHDSFIQRVEILKGWNINVLGDDPKLSVFSFFRRGTAICRNSLAFNWIIIVKSGSISVLARLERRRSMLSSKTGRQNKLRHSSAKLDGKEILYRFILGKDQQVLNDDQFSNCSENYDRLLRVIDEQNARTPSLPSSRSSIAATPNSHNQRVHSSAQNTKTIQMTESGEQLLGRRTLVDDLQNELAEPSNDKLEDISVKSFTRMLLEKVLSESHDVASNPEYVRIQTLTKGQTFGLQPCLYDDQPGLMAVSNGAECLLVNRKYFFEHCDVHHWRRLRSLIPPLPSAGSLQDSLQAYVNWSSFRHATVHQAKIERLGERQRSTVWSGRDTPVAQNTSPLR